MLCRLLPPAQFYYGAAAETDKAAIKYAIKDAKDATGEYTIVLKA